MKKIIYCSINGRSKRVAKLFENQHDVRNSPTLDSEFIIFICPTYGDAELPLLMEEYLLKIKVKNKLYTTVELGNYYGYDDFTFGAKKIIKNHLSTLNWIEFFPSLSLDSMPKIDLKTFFSWKSQVEDAIKNIIAK